MTSDIKKMPREECIEFAVGMFTHIASMIDHGRATTDDILRAIEGHKAMLKDMRAEE